MGSRDTVIQAARAQLGYLDGAGYDGPNKFSSSLGLPPEAWCGDFVTCSFRDGGAPLPSMQAGHPTGYSYCPDAVAYGRQHGASRPSWEAQPGDIFLFDWNGDGTSDHTELMVAKNGDIVFTVGGNSGPSGGVNQHQWNCPPGAGNREVLMTLNADALVRFGSSPVPAPAPIPHPVPPAPTPGVPPWPGRMFVLKTPNMSGTDVAIWQRQMAHRGWSLGTDGIYGPQSRQVCLRFQQQKHLGVDGIVGPATWAAAWTAPVT